MGGDPTFFGSVAETTNLYLQHEIAKQYNIHMNKFITEKNSQKKRRNAEIEKSVDSSNIIQTKVEVKIMILLGIGKRSRDHKS